MDYSISKKGELEVYTAHFSSYMMYMYNISGTMLL
jgi:hypothetical protein